MKKTWQRISLFLAPPLGNGARDVLAFLSLVYGLAYLVAGARTINVFPAEVYGALLILSAATLLLTRNCKRLHWQGRTAAVYAFMLWTLIVVSAWGAWVSISGAAVLAAVAANEARTHVC